MPLELIGVTIEDNPKIICNSKINIDISYIETVKEYIQTHKELLLQYWNGEIDDILFFDKESEQWI